MRGCLNGCLSKDLGWAFSLCRLTSFEMAGNSRCISPALQDAFPSPIPAFSYNRTASQPLK